jgi:hypothetical protein
MLDFKLLNSQAFLNGELIFRAFLSCGLGLMYDIREKISVYLNLVL